MKKFLLALDAGHGLDTPGKRCLKSLDPRETREWVLNDRICDYIAKRAAQYDGFEILRVDDITGKQDVPLTDRTDKANAANADLYLSCHHNAGVEGGSGGGVVAFTYTKNSAKSVAWRDAIYDATVDAGGLRGNRAEPKTTENFQVLRKAAMPAVLVEFGFMDSRTDVPVILSEDYAKAVGCAVADRIAREAGLEQVTPFTDVPAGAWYAEAVSYCARHGLMNGKGDGIFDPTAPVTRAELATVAMRLHKALAQ